MRYVDFEDVMSITRINRYLVACNNNSRKAMTLYRKNLQLSQELFTVISCFEVALRNGIDKHYTLKHGKNWLRDGTITGGIFDNNNCRHTKNIISRSVANLSLKYNHFKLLAEMDFGFWRYLFVSWQGILRTWII